MAINQQLVGTSATTIFTAASESATTSIFFMNNNAAARVIQVYVVPNGSSAAVTTQIIKDLTLDPADTYIINSEKLILAAGDTIQCTASHASSIYATVSFVVI